MLYGASGYLPIEFLQFDDRSTYLQFYLNGFSIDGSANRIVWRDYKTPVFGEPSSKARRNVFKDKVKTILCDRPWAFRRDDRLSTIRVTADSPQR